MNNYWNTTSTGYNAQWVTSTSFGKDQCQVHNKEIIYGKNIKCFTVEKTVPKQNNLSIQLLQV